ncbi:MAG: hypothetical protein OEY43_04875 [Gammaproteobacteria bacterium]|nr:hypothetical protein [Gammaproteobacteria bacterium]
MLLLASGRVVDISTARSKYHALKQHGPAANAGHRALYGLVDIIYRLRDDDGEPRRGWTEYDYIFSGHTLADIHQADDWNDDDIAELQRWAAQDTQRIRIETARRRLIDSQQQLSVKHNLSAQSLYSLLRQRIEVMALSRASAGQWQATLHNMQQAGIRQEEISWSGLPRFLSRQDAGTMLTKQHILDAINFDNIRLELSTEQIWGTNGGLNFKEVAQRMPHQVVYRAALKLDASCHCILRYVDNTFNYRVGVIKTLDHEHQMAMNRFWFALDPYGRAISNDSNRGLYFDNSDAAKNAANNHARHTIGLRSGSKFHTRFDHLTLYGGDNYREWIVSLPDYPRIFYGAHYMDHNVLAHIRTTTRHDSQGRKLLFIEEVQSDWHQHGHLHGYDNSCWGKIANAPFKKEWPALATKLMLIRASQNGYDGIAWPDGDIQETRYSQDLNAIKRHYDDEIPRALNRLGKAFDCRVERTGIETRDPWLNLVKTKNKWRVSDGQGKFETRNKYDSREEAMAVLHRHCKSIQLSVSAFFINDSLRRQIAEQGLPLFGETSFIKD